MVAVAATFTKEMSPSPPSSGSLIKINLQKLLNHFCQFFLAIVKNYAAVMNQAASVFTELLLSYAA